MVPAKKTNIAHHPVDNCIFAAQFKNKHSIIDQYLIQKKCTGIFLEVLLILLQSASIGIFWMDYATELPEDPLQLDSNKSR